MWHFSHRCVEDHLADRVLRMVHHVATNLVVLISQAIRALVLGRKKQASILDPSAGEDDSAALDLAVVPRWVAVANRCHRTAAVRLQADGCGTEDRIGTFFAEGVAVLGGEVGCLAGGEVEAFGE